MKKLFLTLFAALICTFAGAQMAKFQALYLFNFAKNTSWPTEDAGKPFVLTVIGDNAVASELKAIVANKSVGDRKVTVLESATATGIQKSDIIYLGESKGNQIGTLTSAQKGNKVLIVSGSKGQCSHGAGIAFVPEGGKLQFEISEKNIAVYGLKVSPKLVQLGKQVD